MSQIIRIATRKSPLAVWQAEFVSERLQTLHPGLRCELVKMTTKGDQILNSPLSKIGGKGLFVKELETALYEKHADLAVHSMKDVPMELPPGLTLSAILAREDPYDAFVSNHYTSLDALPASAIVGTSSLRRAAQLKTHYPSLVIKDLRGNVNTRLAKLDAGEFDAVILASAGLKRLGFTDRIRTIITDNICLPAVGQGALGIECREDDDNTRALIKMLNDEQSAVCVKAERAMNLRLNGGCQVPIAGYAILQKNELWLRGLVAAPNGSQLLQSDIRGPMADAENLGTQVANHLLAQGADKILRAIYA